MNKFNIGQTVYFLRYESISDMSIATMEITGMWWKTVICSIVYNGKHVDDMKIIGRLERDIFESEEALKQFIKEKLNIE